MTKRLGIPGVDVRALVRGSSADHPSIQLADLLAGAAATVADHHADKTSEAAEDLWDTVIPLVEDQSLLPYDTATTWADITTAPH